MHGVPRSLEPIPDGGAQGSGHSGAVSQHSERGRPWRRFRLMILERDGWRCQIRTPGVCKGKATTVDHIRRLKDGGRRLDPNNARGACSPCNRDRERKVPHVDEGWTW